MTDVLHSFTLADMVRQQARVLPGTTAIVDGDDRYTFADMDRAANRWANWLAARSVGLGDRVAWHGPGDVRTLHLLFAAAKLGAALVPLNVRNTAEETARALETAAPALVLSTTPLDGAIDADAQAPAVRAAPADEPAIDPDDERPVLGVFTGAFSGRPKLALLTHRGIVTQSLVTAAYRLIEPGATRYLASGPMFHVGVHLKLLANYLFGGLSVLAPHPDAAALCRLIERERVTSALLFTPSIDQMIQANADRRHDLSSLRDVPAQPSDPSDGAWYEMTSCLRASGPTGYGQTETYAMVSFEARGPSGTGAFGRPSPVAAVGVARPGGIESAPGEPGEITVRGPQIMAGYLGEPVGIRHRTGDLGVFHPDGTLDFVGPVQEVIKTGMENVYPAEVEIALRRHPAVAEACVIGIPDPQWGSSVRAVVEAGAECTADELIEHTRRHIASYKKPRSVIFVAKLPRNAAGQVDRGAVHQKWGS
ncbi:AMP-dependent synthetase [Actinomadura darangshiensis]|uniref:AMP-dependent synthetase n=1 Tax=Actinomadura darangshiensis TaxID=705336 RepID=A0A4R5B2N5_9ACTN|nr:AMP-binding protein [Actinomadura darangshiensis]TDD79253.1 AMP-dependent synthetase [Actinomadura darangshiensis]